MAEFKLTSLDDLKPIDVEVRIERPDGDVLIVPMSTLTYGEYVRYGAEIISPPPPIAGTDNVGRPVFDQTNADWLRAVNEAERRRNFRRLVASLKIDIPGDTVGEQIDYLERTLDANIARQLINLMTDLAMKGDALINARAESFHRNGTADTADNGTTADEPESVVEPAGKRKS